MKHFIFLMLLVSIALPAGAAKAKKKHASLLKKVSTTTTSQTTGQGRGQERGKKISFANEKKLSTDVVFDGSMVNGRYHTAGEAVATVETEKKMNELVGFRRDFKDRLVEERSRLKSQGI